MPNLIFPDEEDDYLTATYKGAVEVNVNKLNYTPEDPNDVPVHTNLLVEWVTRLGLQDWVIKLEDDCKPEDMDEFDVAGCVSYSEPGKCAKIQIIDPKYYGKRIVVFDYEKTLVHELLHLKLSLLADKTGDLQERYVHQIIDDLAKALVDAKRSGTE